MTHTLLRSTVLLVGLVLGAPVMADDIDAMPITVTFAISGGFWVDPGVAPAPSAGAEPGKQDAGTPARRGYYKLVAVRQPDRTAKVYLQQIASTDAGPELLDTVELEEFTAMKPYVTDIRPEDSTGITRQPGMMATVYLKTDPQAVEPDGWTVLIDEFGDITVEKATN